MDDDPLFMIDQMMDKFDDVLVAPMEDEFPASLGKCSPSTLILSGNSTNTLCESPATAASTEVPPPQPIISGGATTTTTAESPNEHRKRNQASSNPVILSFSNSSEEKVREGSPKVGRSTAKKNKSRVRPPSQTYDHIVAERKRREQLSRLFVALSALVPGLKKMDKTTVLGDAINYLKQLQERVQKLEEQTVNQNMESVIVVKKSQLFVDGGDGEEEEGYFEENLSGLCGHNEPLQEIGAIVCGRSILLRIHCDKHKGLLVKVLSEIENLNLTITNTSVVQFGHFALDVTVIAEMEQEFSMTVKDVVRKLRTNLRLT